MRKIGWRERAKRVRLLLLDVDGVLTDGRLAFDGAGREIKFFHIRDGQGIRFLQQAGIRVGIVTGRKSEAVDFRAQELGIDLIFQKVRDKEKALGTILKKENLQAEQVCYVGDDLVDLAVLSSVGLGVAVADAAAEVRTLAHYTTRFPGGQGAVREICERILKAQGKWERIIQTYRYKATGDCSAQY
ncbi:MAG TPA: HAD-IIIA family hydrolase [Thermodesulfobacteriota bacterium]|nr:HAD-IIIA family hydrolase [Thermodesulfobacteriota bacterium]